MLTSPRMLSHIHDPLSSSVYFFYPKKVPTEIKKSCETTYLLMISVYHSVSLKILKRALEIKGIFPKK